MRVLYNDQEVKLGGGRLPVWARLDDVHHLLQVRSHSVAVLGLGLGLESQARVGVRARVRVKVRVRVKSQAGEADVHLLLQARPPQVLVRMGSECE